MHVGIFPIFVVVVSHFHFVGLVHKVNTIKETLLYTNLKKTVNNKINNLLGKKTFKIFLPELQPEKVKPNQAYR